MRKIFLLLVIAFAFIQTHAQFVYKIKADSVLITNDSCTAELNLENSTKNVKGFLYNKGNGRTEFRKVVKLNDSTLVIGSDTLTIQGSSGNYIRNQNAAAQPANFRIQGNGVIGSFGNHRSLLGSFPAQAYVTHSDGNNGLSIQRASDNTGTANLTFFKNRYSDFSALGAAHYYDRIGQINFMAVSGDSATISTGANISTFIEKVAGNYISSGVEVWTRDTNGVFKSSAYVSANGDFRLGGIAAVTRRLEVQSGDVMFNSLSGSGNVLAGADNNGVFKKIKLGPTLSFANDTLNVTSGNSWSLTGNAGTNPASNFIGTTDSQDVAIRTKNIERMRIGATGYVGIGTTNPTSYLHIVDNSSSNNAPLNITVNSNGFPATLLTNTNPGIWAGAGAVYANDAGQFLQYYMGSSINGFTPARVLIRSTGNNGMKISTDKGQMQFQIGTVVAQGLADTANVKMEIDSFGVRIRKADLVTYDTATYQTVIMAKSNGRIFKANIPTAGTGWSLSGNAGTDTATNFIGTTDNKAMVFRTNNTNRMRLAEDGSLLIGKTTSNGYGKLQVQGSSYITDSLHVGINFNGVRALLFGYPSDVSPGWWCDVGLSTSPIFNNQTSTALTGRGNAGVRTNRRINDITFGQISPTRPAIHINPGNLSGYETHITGKTVIGGDSAIGALIQLIGTTGISDTLKMPNIISKSDTAAYKPVVIDASGNVFKSGAWPAKQTFAQTATATVAATNTETTLISSGTGSLTIPASAWVVGKTYKIVVRGVWSTDANNPAGINIKLKLGSTVIAQSANMFLGTGKSNVPYEVRAEFTCRSTGASGTIFTMGLVYADDAFVNKFDNGTTTSTINLTGNQTLDVTATLSDNAAGNSISSYIVFFEAAN